MIYYALLRLATVEEIDAYAIHGKSHTHLVFHQFCTGIKLFMKLNRLLIIPICLVYDSKIKRQMCFLLDITGLHTSIGSDQEILDRFFVRIFKIE